MKCKKFVPNDHLLLTMIWQNFNLQGFDRILILHRFYWKCSRIGTLYLLLLFFFFQSAQRYLLKLHIYSGIFSLWNANDWADFLCNINWWYFPFDDESGIGKKNARFYLRICDREKQLNNSNRGRIGHTNRSVQVLGGCCAQVNETKFMFYVGIGEDMFFWEDIYVL